MKKRLFPLLLLIPGALASAQGVVDIRYNGGTASVNIPADVRGVSQSVQGANVVITSTTTDTEYTYHVSGTSNNGSLVINGQYKLTLQLDGLTLTNAHGGAAIDVACGKRIAVELADGTVSTLSDIATGNQKAALYFKGHPEFRDGGTLNVTGKLKHAIAAKEYIELKPSLGTINILGAAGDGIHCGRGVQDPEKNYFLMRGGAVNISNVANEGIDADDYGAVRLVDGGVSINVGQGGTGVKADSTLLIEGGLMNILVSGNDAVGLLSRYSTTLRGGRLDLTVAGDGSKGIKAKKQTAADATVTDGGRLNIDGGRVRIVAQGGSIVDPQTGDTDRCIAISTDADLTQTGGDVHLTTMGLDARSHNVKGTERHAAGQWNISRQPWVTDDLATHYEMTILVAVSIDGQQLSDYSQVAVGAFFGNTCAGCADFTGNAGYGLLRVRSATVSKTDPMTFRLYNYADNTELQLTAPAPVTFVSNQLEGTPSQPVVLSLVDDQGLHAPAPDGAAATGYTTLSGQHVMSPEHPGIYISAGRKHIVRRQK